MNRQLEQGKATGKGRGSGELLLRMGPVPHTRWGALRLRLSSPMRALVGQGVHGASLCLSPLPSPDASRACLLFGGRSQIPPLAWGAHSDDGRQKTAQFSLGRGGWGKGEEGGGGGGGGGEGGKVTAGVTLLGVRQGPRDQGAHAAPAWTLSRPLLGVPYLAVPCAALPACVRPGAPGPRARAERLTLRQTSLLSSRWRRLGGPVHLMSVTVTVAPQPASPPHPPQVQAWTGGIQGQGQKSQHSDPGGAPRDPLVPPDCNSDGETEARGGQGSTQGLCA